MEFTCQPCAHPSGAHAAAFVAPLSEIAQMLRVPVRSTSPNRRLAQVTSPDWDRILQPWGNLDFPLPIVLSSRTNWTLSGNKLEVFAEAYIIDGACRLEAQLQSEPMTSAIFTVLLGLAPDEELMLREAVFQQSPSEPILEQRVGTDTPRLKVESRWVLANIESEPFVVPTRRGYTAAVLVRRKGVNHAEHILVGARSVSEPLELARLRHGHLEGLQIRMRKTGDTATSPYEVIIDR